MAVALFKLPSWLKKHLYFQKQYADLSEIEINDIRTRLQKFQDSEPEVSVIIPAWNEQNNIYRTLSSLASTTSTRKVELVVVNNNSTDNSQQVLDQLGVKSYFEPKQGITYARQLGLEKAKGKYHLCADSE